MRLNGVIPRGPTSLPDLLFPGERTPSRGSLREFVKLRVGGERAFCLGVMAFQEP